MALMDRRKNERYDLRTSLSFSWKDLRNVRHRRDGLLSNISGGGLFVLTRDPPPTGSRINVSVSFETALPGRRLAIWITGQVVRVELPVEAEDTGGFAVVIKRYTLRSE